jgi:mRNA interferase YafQ
MRSISHTSQFRDHPLKGGYAGCRECHLRPDLLLIYIQSATELKLVRLGSHSELFD